MSVPRTEREDFKQEIKGWIAKKYIHHKKLFDMGEIGCTNYDGVMLLLKELEKDFDVR